MKKNFRRAMAAVMAAALTLSLAGTAAEADAAKKKKIKLASKSVTVNVKKTKTVKIKNVKAKQVKKLTVKSASKKIATAKAKGKTAVKVTGKKAGKSTKVTVTLKIKGQKKATKLTLKVKVTKAKPPVPATNAPAPATQAPNVPSTKAPDAPAVSQPPQGGDASQAPATQKPTDKPKESKTPKPEWTPDPDKQNKVEDFTLTYGENGEGYKFEAAKMVNFSDAANYASAAPKDGIDVRYYDQVIVNYKSDEEITSGDEGWGGKATLSSTDEGLGCTAYTDGLYLRYLNDLKYAEGGYTVEYNIKKTGEHGALNDGYDFEDVGLVDCISVQLESNTHPYVDSEDGSQKGVNFRLMSIEFKAPAKAPGESAKPGESAQPGASAKPGESAQPGASAKPGASANPGASAKPGASATPTATPTAPPVSLKVVKNTLTVGDKTAVNVTSTEQGVTIGEKNLTVTNVPESNEVLAVLNDAKTELEAKKKGTVKITGTVQITYSGIPYTVPVTSEEIIIHAVDELVAEVHVETSPVELVADGTKTLTATGTATINDVVVTDATFTYTWASADTSVVEVADGVITAKGVGETTVTVTAVAHKTGKTDSDPSRAVVIPVKVYEKLAVTDTGNIEYAETEVAINGTVAPKALKGTAITTNGEIEAANVTWALADSASAEFASIDAATGAVTGKKAGEVNVKATVKVTSGAGQEKTVEVTGTVTVNENVEVLKTALNSAKYTATNAEINRTSFLRGENTAAYSFIGGAWNDSDATCAKLLDASNTTIKVKVAISNAKSGFTLNGLKVCFGGWYPVEKIVANDNTDGVFSIDISDKSKVKGTDGAKIVVLPKDNVTGAADVKIESIQIGSDSPITNLGASADWKFKGGKGQYEKLMSIAFPDNLGAINDFETIKVEFTSEDNTGIQVNLAKVVEGANPTMGDGKDTCQYVAANAGSATLTLSKFKNLSEMNSVWLATNDFGFKGEIKVDKITFVKKNS